MKGPRVRMILRRNELLLLVGPFYVFVDSVQLHSYGGDRFIILSFLRSTLRQEPLYCLLAILLILDEIRLRFCLHSKF